MPNKDGNMQFTISDILEKVAEIENEISIVLMAIDMHNDKIDTLFHSLLNSPGNIAILKYDKSFNMWCMQNPNTHKQIDNYIDQFMDYVKAVRDFGYTANDATKIAVKLRILLDVIEKRRLNLINDRRELEELQLREIPRNDNLDQLIEQLNRLLISAEPIINDLYGCEGKIDEAMRGFIHLVADDDTYNVKVLQKLKQHPDIKEWCKPWAINWDDPEEEPDPAKTAIAALPPLCVEVISYEQGNRRTAFTIS